MSAFVRIGLNLGCRGAGNDAATLSLAQEVDKLGYPVVWVAARTRRRFPDPGEDPGHNGDGSRHPRHVVRPAGLGRPHGVRFDSPLGRRNRELTGETAEVREKYLAKDYPGALAAVPLDFVDATSPLGPKERIAERMTAFAEVGVTTLTVAPYLPDPSLSAAALRTAAEAFESAGVA